jgi:hypothetical protein
MEDRTLVCKHCNGTGICKQAKDKISKTEKKFLRNEDVIYYEEGEIVDYHWRSGEPVRGKSIERHSYKPIYGDCHYRYKDCVICGKTEIVCDQEPDELLCKVCDGKGYILGTQLSKLS